MHSVGLPYIDNAKAVLVTLVINMGVVFVFNWPEGVTYSGVLWDSLFCAGITTTINMWIVYSRLKKIRAMRGMPSHVPVSRFMQRLPQNPYALGVVYIVVFGALTVGVNAAVLWFFNMRSLTFAPWAVYKLLYATILSVTITEYCIFRYVQPDWASAGSSKTEIEQGPAVSVVKDPLPKVSVFKEVYGSVTGNIALNIIIGSLLGGVMVGPDGSTVIAPTTVQGIPITGLIFGLISGVLITNGVVKKMNASILASQPVVAETAVTDTWLAWMPKGRAALTCCISVGVMAFSATALWSIMKLFNIAVMNFYQFTVFITAYASILSKPLSYVLVRRCLAPDYVRCTLERDAVKKSGVI